MAPLWLTIESLSLGETRRFLMVLPPLKWVWMPYLPQIFLILSTNTLCVGYDNMTLTLHPHGWQTGHYYCPHHWPAWKTCWVFSPPCPKPIWGSYIWWEHSWGAPFLFEATQDYCTQWKPYGRGFGWHWTWLRGDGDCPPVNTGLYV